MWTEEGRRRAVERRVYVRAQAQAAHDERVRPYFELAARLDLRGVRLTEWLDANGVPPPRPGIRWSRQAARRISRRLGLA